MEKQKWYELRPIPELPAPAGEITVCWGTPQQTFADGYSAAQMDAHARAAWTAGLDCGMAHAPAADETTLPDLARLLGTASKEGKAVKLSPVAAGTLYNAMTAGAAARPADPDDMAANYDHSTHDKRMEELKGLRAEQPVEVAPSVWPEAWHALRNDVLSGVDGLDNDQVNTILGMLDNYEPAAAQPVAEPYAEDPVDIIRTLLCTVDHYWSLPDEKREAYPSPTAELSPLMQAARRACVERGFTAGGLAIDPTAGSAT